MCQRLKLSRSSCGWPEAVPATGTCKRDSKEVQTPFPSAWLILISININLIIFHRAFHRILNNLVSPTFYNRYVRLPPNNQTPPEVRENPKLYPFLKNCLGALDGSHLDAFVPERLAAAYRDRKGRLSTNILAACTFDLRFCYLLVGWEGSAADGRIFHDARNKGLAIPSGKFYLGDAGFPSCDTLLVPYRGVRYHLKEWGRAPQK